MCEFRIAQTLLTSIRNDLARPHAFAFERVGFIRCRIARSEDVMAVLAESYMPIDDADYLQDDTVGAVMGSAAIRKALQDAYSGGTSMFHVHCHEHFGNPRFSAVDLEESGRFVPDFWKVQHDLPHGAIVLSLDRAAGLVWDPKDRSVKPLTSIIAVGRTIETLG